MATRPYEYYRLYQLRLEHADDVIKARVASLFYVEAAALFFATAACCGGWATLARQAEILTYNSEYVPIVSTNCVAFTCFVCIQLTLCYCGGWKVTNESKAMIDRAVKAWQCLAEEGSKIKTMWESQYRPSDETFPIAPFLSESQGDGLWMAHSGVDTLGQVFRLVRLMWLVLFVTGIAFVLVEVCIIWSVVIGGRSILL